MRDKESGVLDEFPRGTCRGPQQETRPNGGERGASKHRGEDQHTGEFISVQKGADRVTFFRPLCLRLITCVALSILTTKSRPCLHGKSFPRAAEG